MGNTHTYRYIKVPSKPSPQTKSLTLTGTGGYGGFDVSGSVSVSNLGSVSAYSIVSIPTISSVVGGFQGLALTYDSTNKLIKCNGKFVGNVASGYSVSVNLTIMVV